MGYYTLNDAARADVVANHKNAASLAKKKHVGEKPVPVFFRYQFRRNIRRVLNIVEYHYIGALDAPDAASYRAAFTEGLYAHSHVVFIEHFESVPRIFDYAPDVRPQVVVLRALPAPRDVSEFGGHIRLIRAHHKYVRTVVNRICQRVHDVRRKNNLVFAAFAEALDGEVVSTVKQYIAPSMVKFRGFHVVVASEMNFAKFDERLSAAKFLTDKLFVHDYHLFSARQYPHDTDVGSMDISAKKSRRREETIKPFTPIC